MGSTNSSEIMWLQRENEYKKTELKKAGDGQWDACATHGAICREAVYTIIKIQSTKNLFRELLSNLHEADNYSEDFEAQSAEEPIYFTNYITNRSKIVLNDMKAV